MIHKTVIKKINDYVFYSHSKSKSMGIILFPVLLAAIIFLLQPLEIKPELSMGLRIFSYTLYTMVCLMFSLIFMLIFLYSWEAITKRHLYYKATWEHYFLFPSQSLFNEVMTMWLEGFVKALENKPGIPYEEDASLLSFANEINALRQLQSKLKLVDMVFPSYSKKLPLIKFENYCNLSDGTKKQISKEINKLS